MPLYGATNQVLVTLLAAEAYQSQPLQAMYEVRGQVVDAHLHTYVHMQIGTYIYIHIHIDI